jgi:dUTP pyrophosphatase
MSTYHDFKMFMRMYEEENPPTLLVKKLHPDAIIPTRATPVAAGLDLYALEGGILGVAGYDNQAMVATGIAIALPPGYEGQVRPRSGLAAKFGVSVTNSPGTIDEDYRGEVKVILVNLGNKPFQWAKGERIAQLVITKANYVEVEESDELPETERGSKGFGSSGR